MSRTLPGVAWIAPESEVHAYLERDPHVKLRVEEVAGEIHGTAVGLARARAYESGDYVAGIEIHDLANGKKAVVATAPHSWFVEVGTGIFGPLRRPVQAQPGRPFVFEDMANGELVKIVTMQHVGRPARHVMRDAAIQAASLPGLTWQPADAGFL